MRFRQFSTAGLLLFWLAILGCRDAKIDGMSSGGNILSGELESWLVLEFKDYPADAGPRDVVVRFPSEALSDTEEFDWDFIADSDVIAGERFGSGNRPNSATTAADGPPLGQPVKVKFPLYAKREIMSDNRAIWLHAYLYWGGVRQDAAKQDIRRLYSPADSKTPNPWTY
jgi:hypothetical protein